MAATGRTAAELAERLLAGDKRALARAISLVEDDDPEGWALVREVYPQTGKAHVIGLTGPPGVGKSTLIGAMTKNARARDRQVAVLSIDPSSPFTQGALLGDRIRLTDHFLDPGVFIRSMASRGSLGGLSEATLQAALLMDASGKDVVLLETVGVGQAEVDIIDHADTVLLALMPGSGDSIQALKAGVMEIPDIIIVNKSDHPLTDTMVREIRGVLSLGPKTSWRVADHQDRGGARRGRRRGGREDRRAPRAHRGRGHARRAPQAQPHERGHGARDDPAAPPARGVAARGPDGAGPAATRWWSASSTRRARRRGCSTASCSGRSSAPAGRSGRGGRRLRGFEGRREVAALPGCVRSPPSGLVARAALCRPEEAARCRRAGLPAGSHAGSGSRTADARAPSPAQHPADPRREHRVVAARVPEDRGPPSSPARAAATSAASALPE